MLKQLGLVSLLATAIFPVYASQHIVVVPSCLLTTTIDYKTLATQQNFSLITTSDKGIDQLVEAKQVMRKKECGGFMDVTQAWNSYQTKSIAKNKAKSFLADHLLATQLSSTKEATYDIKYSTQVNQLIATINPQDMWSDLTTLTKFPDRYSRGDNGVKAAEWFKSQVETLAKNNGRNDVTVYFVQTGGYKQPSVVAKIGNGNDPAAVIGGHMDTLSSSWELKPGADDDGSGSVTVLEAARVLLNSGMHFKKPIYLVWYAAEEMGLVGSQYVVKDFQAKKIPVDAVMQLDMTAYEYHNEPTIWLMDDYVNKDVSKFVETLISTYVKVPVKHSRCGYACSDHASWTQGGFKSSMPFETEMNRDNPDIHTSNDTMDKLSLQHMHDFAKMAVAFAVEVAEPVV
ncbi:MAG: Aminopeptidase [uncultured bacterium]|nr:MAG: Aminopeptidase [uncultured bacterium]